MKIRLMILLSIMMMVVMAGCGNSQDSSLTSGTDEDTVQNTGDETISSSEETFKEPFNTSPTIEETVLWDENDVKITATSLEYTNSSVNLNMKIENNSDKKLNFTASTVGTPWNAVNGYMISDGYLNKDVEAGETLEDDISFSISTLNIYGINEIADIQLGITVKDEDYNSFYLSPQKIETSIAESYNYDDDTYIAAVESGLYEKLNGINTDYFSKDILFDSNGISLKSEALFSIANDSVKDEDDTDQEASTPEKEYELMLEIENLSEYNIYAVISDISINDVNVYDRNWNSEALIAGTKGLLYVDLKNLFSASDEDETLISEGVDNITFTITIENENYEEALTPETITINFN